LNDKEKIINQNSQAFPVEFDDARDSWVVKMPEGDVACESKADANCIASLNNLYSEALSKCLFSADEHRRIAFRDSANRVVKLVNQYGVRCKASRAVELALIRIEESLNE
jgi:hypothetical protein